MFGKSHQGLTIRHVLWSAFYINIILFLIAIWLGSNLLLISCILASLFIIVLGNKHQKYIISLNTSFEYVVDKRVSFLSCLKQCLFSRSSNKIEESDLISNETITFSIYSTSSHKEYLIQSKLPTVVNEEQCVITIGSSQCEKPCSLGMLNISLSEARSYRKEHSGFVWDNFGIVPNDYSLFKKDVVDFILKVPVNKDLTLGDRSVGGLFSQQIFWLPSVKAIELYMEKSNAGYYSLTEFIGKKSNLYFHSIPTMLNFILHMREIVNGKPIGIKIGIGVENEFRELCRIMKERNIFVDFISIIGDDEVSGVKGEINKSLDCALAFARTTLKKFHLEKEVKLIAVGNIKNGFELLKLLSIGANSCINQSTLECKSMFYYSGERKDILEYHRNVLKEAIQLMKLSGFNGVESISPKKFFRQDSNERISSFEEIYFKNDYNHTYDSIKNFMYN